MILLGLVYYPRNKFCGESSVALSLAVFLITCFSIFRYDIGFDYQAYFRFISMNSEEGIERFEPISYSLMYLARWIGYPPVVFILFGIPTYMFMYKGFKKNSVNVGLSIVIYLSLFYLFSLGAIRQALAMSICLYNYTNLRQCNSKKFVIYVVVATLVHYSAIITLILYPIYHFIKFRTLIIISIVLFAIKQVFVYVIINYTVYGAYLDETSSISGGRFKQLFYIALFVSIFLLVKVKNFSKEEKCLMKILFVSLLFPFYFGTALGDRISNNLYIYYCYFFPLLLHNKYKYKRIIYNLIFLCYFFFYIYYTSYGTGGAAPYLPYKTIFTSYGDVFKTY